MAGKKTTNGAASGEENLSPAEMEYLTAYFKLCTNASKPQPVDVAALGAMFELKDKKTVMQRFNRICDKFGWFKAQPAEGPSTPSGGGASAKKKAPAGGRKKNNPAAPATPAKYEGGDDAEAEGAEDPSPSKKRKITGDDEA